MSTEALNLSRKKLIDALGDNKQEYFHFMKLWFRMKISKEEFDSNARNLLLPDTIHLHNEFFLAILTKCQINSSTSSPVKVQNLKSELFCDATIKNEPFSEMLNQSSDRKKLKPKKKRPTKQFHENNFEPVSLLDIAPTPTLREPQALSEASPGYHSRSFHLLDVGPLKGRLLLAAWDYGLTSAADSVALLLHEATKQCLKNIIALLISRRKGYKIREGRFIHSLGTVPSNPWLRNANFVKDWASESIGLPYSESFEDTDRPVWPSVEAAEQNAAHLASCGTAQDGALAPISCFDLFHTLKIHKSVLPCHTVYSLCMERISSHLWHPSWSELEQETIAMKEAAAREAN